VDQSRTIRGGAGTANGTRRFRNISSGERKKNSKERRPTDDESLKPRVSEQRNRVLGRDGVRVRSSSQNTTIDGKKKHRSQLVAQLRMVLYRQPSQSPLSKYRTRGKRKTNSTHRNSTRNASRPRPTPVHKTLGEEKNFSGDGPQLLLSTVETPWDRVYQECPGEN